MTTDRLARGRKPQPGEPFSWHLGRADKEAVKRGGNPWGISASPSGALAITPETPIGAVQTAELLEAHLAAAKQHASLVDPTPVRWQAERVIHLNRAVPDDQIDPLAATFLDERSYDYLITQQPTDVFKPDGSLLLRYTPHAVSVDLCRIAYQNLRSAAVITSNRGDAGGIVQPAEERGDARQLGTRSKTRFRPIKRSTGELSHSSYSNHVRSGVIGYFDRQDRFPYCRMTSYTIDKYPQYAAALPFVRAVDRVFSRVVPDRYAVQRYLVDHSSSDFVIGGTAFSTVTVNRNFRTAVHKDVGDLREGFGVITVLEAGSYTGGYLVFPKYRVAVDLRTTGVLCADFHEWHGNTPILGGHYERVSCVFYYRARMIACGTAEEEQRRADGVQVGKQLRWAIESPLTTLDEA